MNRITHKYKVSLQLLNSIEKFVKEKNPTLDEIMCEFRRLKLFYQCGLSKLER